MLRRGTQTKAGAEEAVVEERKTSNGQRTDKKKRDMVQLRVAPEDGGDVSTLFVPRALIASDQRTVLGQTFRTQGEPACMDMGRVTWAACAKQVVMQYCGQAIDERAKVEETLGFHRACAELGISVVTPLHRAFLGTVYMPLEEEDKKLIQEFVMTYVPSREAALAGEDPDLLLALHNQEHALKLKERRALDCHFYEGIGETDVMSANIVNGRGLTWSQLNQDKAEYVKWLGADLVAAVWSTYPLAALLEEKLGLTEKDWEEFQPDFFEWRKETAKRPALSEVRTDAPPPEGDFSGQGESRTEAARSSRLVRFFDRFRSKKEESVSTAYEMTETTSTETPPDKPPATEEDVARCDHILRFLEATYDIRKGAQFFWVSHRKQLADLFTERAQARQYVTRLFYDHHCLSVAWEVFHSACHKADTRASTVAVLHDHFPICDRTSICDYYRKKEGCCNTPREVKVLRLQVSLEPKI